MGAQGKLRTRLSIQQGFLGAMTCGHSAGLSRTASGWASLGGSGITTQLAQQTHAGACRCSPGTPGAQGGFAKGKQVLRVSLSSSSSLLLLLFALLACL